MIVMLNLGLVFEHTRYFMLRSYETTMKAKTYLIAIFFTILFSIWGLAGCTNNPGDQLQAMIAAYKLTPIEPAPYQEPALISLGQMLYFDKVLSGNRDISCATCHHPLENSADNLALSIGTGGFGLGKNRQPGRDRPFIPRNAPDIFNRGFSEWQTMFWDSRVAIAADGSFISPASANLPYDLNNLLAVQAMFPVTSDSEMRGVLGDEDVWGEANELAHIDSNDLPEIWSTIMRRLLHYPEYAMMFAAAYPDVPLEQLGFEHAANAIAAFEIYAFTMPDSPWDRYLRGDKSALTELAKQGAVLFYGKAGCVRCHSGTLFTDQQHHNLAVPQIGPGKGASAPLDYGLMLLTGNEADKFAFRTPPLRNVTVTSPWMHNGAFNSLEAVIAHHLDPRTSLYNYDPQIHLRAELRPSFQNSPAIFEELLADTDQKLQLAKPLSAEDIEALMAFLDALTDPRVNDLYRLVPHSVPSGLPVLENLIVSPTG